ncbi:Gfo/Idh/MocA family oxidoreductase [Dactylosporangium salmoneum]|uniref:Gfo/Idh/MocA family oxidoreductase n=1 Tax=Dactylosporangium salmoneum TaxID=53361 RepID=A0ABN3HUF6_9ACTN
MSALRVAVIGAGDFGVRHLEAYRRAGAEVAAIADTDRARAERVAARHGVPRWFTDGAELLDAVRPHAVSVVTPSATHVPLALAALDAGCAVLLEKPVADDRRRLRLLREHPAADRVMPAHVLRFDPAYLELRDRFRSGAIGELRALEAHRHRESGHRTRYPAADPAGLTAVHDIDLAGWIAGWPPDPVPVSARGLDTGQDLGGYVHAVLSPAPGVLWSITAGWLLAPDSGGWDRLTLHGSAGSLTVTAAGGRYEVLHDGRPVAAGSRPEAPGLDGTIGHFLAAVHAGEPFTVPLDEAWAGLGLVEAVCRSARAAGAPVGWSSA